MERLTTTSTKPVLTNVEGCSFLLFIWIWRGDVVRTQPERFVSISNLPLGCGNCVAPVRQLNLWLTFSRLLNKLTTSFFQGTPFRIIDFRAEILCFGVVQCPFLSLTKPQRFNIYFLWLKVKHVELKVKWCLFAFVSAVWDMAAWTAFVNVLGAHLWNLLHNSWFKMELPECSMCENIPSIWKQLSA